MAKKTMDEDLFQENERVDSFSEGGVEKFDESPLLLPEESQDNLAEGMGKDVSDETILVADPEEEPCEEPSLLLDESELSVSVGNLAEPSEQDEPDQADVGVEDHLESVESEVPAASRVLTIENRSRVELPETQEEIVWHEIQSAMRTRRILTGNLGGIEQLEGGSSVAIVYYKELRVVIPVSEMMLQLAENRSYGTVNERQSMILNNMLGCEIDFMVKGADSRSRSVVGSRREAMMRKRRNFYVRTDESGVPMIQEGRIVQARVVAVATKAIRVEAFGVETSIFARDISWDWIGDAHERYRVGDRVLIRVNSIQGETLEDLSIEADMRSVTENKVRENLQKCKVQGKYAGTITDIRNGTTFLRLAIGVNAIAHTCLDRRMPGIKDEVSFVVTHVDTERAMAAGIITRIIRQTL